MGLRGGRNAIENQEFVALQGFKSNNIQNVSFLPAQKSLKLPAYVLAIKRRDFLQSGFLNRSECSDAAVRVPGDEPDGIQLRA
jgi:hypothetical protein